MMMMSRKSRLPCTFLGQAVWGNVRFFKFLIYVNDVGDDDCDNDDDDDDIQEIMMMMMSRKSRVSCTVLGQDIWGKDMFLNFQFM